jgi:hypothetical protein
VVECRPVTVRSPAHWPRQPDSPPPATDIPRPLATASRTLSRTIGSPRNTTARISPRKSGPDRANPRSARTLRSPSPSPSVSEPAASRHRHVAGSGPETQNGRRADRKTPPNGAAGTISHQRQETSTPHRTHLGITDSLRVIDSPIRVAPVGRRLVPRQPRRLRRDFRRPSLHRSTRRTIVAGAHRRTRRVRPGKWGELVKLAVSLSAGHNVDTPAVVAIDTAPD